MRLRTKVWIIVVVLCLAGTVWEIPNACLIWRCASMGRRENLLADRPDPATALTDPIRRTDPEAAAILTLCLGEPNERESAQRVIEYPDNEFFLAQLANELIDANCIDPRAALTLADRLIALSPDNAHYHYLKGWILLKGPWAPGRERAALEAFQSGNELPQFYLPYSRYADRVDSLCDRAAMGPMARNRAQPSETGMYVDLGVFLARLHVTYPALDPEIFGDLSRGAVHAANHLMQNAQAYGHLEAGAMLLNAAERARLSGLDLPPDQAQQARFHMSQAIAIQDVLDTWFSEALSTLMDLVKIVLLASVPLLLLMQLPLVWLFLLIVNGFRGHSHHARVGVKVYILFLVGLAGTFGFLLVPLLVDRWLPTQPWAAFLFLVVPIGVWILLWLLSHVRPVDHACFRRARRRAGIVCGLVWGAGTVFLGIMCLGPEGPSRAVEWMRAAGIWFAWSALWSLLWLAGAYRQHAIRAIPYDRLLRNRLVQLVLMLVFMTGATTLVRPLPALPILSVFLTILFAGIIAAHRHDGYLILADALRRFFSRIDEVTATRTRVFRMLSAILVVCWAGVLIGIHLSAARWQHLDRMFTDPLSLYRPLPQASQETYDRVIVKSKPVAGFPRDDPDAGLPELFELMAPDDMAAIIAQRRDASQPLSDRRLLMSLSKAARDTRPVLIGAMHDPNTLDVLLLRARWGDSTVKDELARTFDENLARLADVVSGRRIGTLNTPSGPFYMEMMDAATSSLKQGRQKSSEPNEVPGPEDQEQDSPLAGLLQMADALASIDDPQGASDRHDRLFKSLTGMPPEMMSTQMVVWQRSASQGEQDAIEAPSTREMLGLLVEFTKNSPPPPVPLTVQDADTVRALIARAQSGDKTVKGRLEAALRTRLELMSRAFARENMQDSLMRSLLRIAGAMAFISEPQETEARFHRLMDLLVEQWHASYSQYQLSSRRASRGRSLRSARSAFTESSLSESFYRALQGVPKDTATALFTTYIQRLDLEGFFLERDFAMPLERLADRALAECILRRVSEAPPTEESYDIPIGRPINLLTEDIKTSHKDVSRAYLEAIFPHLDSESAPLLMQALDAAGEPVRAFAVWTLSSLGYKWTVQQLDAIARDSSWKVRLNTAIARRAVTYGEGADEGDAVDAIARAMLGSDQDR